MSLLDHIPCHFYTSPISNYQLGIVPFKKSEVVHLQIQFTSLVSIVEEKKDKHAIHEGGGGRVWGGGVGGVVFIILFGVTRKWKWSLSIPLLNVELGDSAK